MKLHITLLLITVCFLTSCKNQNATKSRGPIVLGDSATIVSETDPNALHDQVTDLQPESTANTDESATTPVKDTIAPATTIATPAISAPPVAGTGLNVPFKEVTLTIPGISTRSYGKPDLEKARGASYELTAGNILSTQLRTSGATVSKVSQRYESIIVMEDAKKFLPLESLGKYTSAWEVVTGNNGVYPISGLDASRLGYKQANPAAIRNAVQEAARKKRLNHDVTQDWLETAREARATNQAPCKVFLRSVMWRVEGKDAAGKSFNKELRLDVPLP